MTYVPLAPLGVGECDVITRLTCLDINTKCLLSDDDPSFRSSFNVTRFQCLRKTYTHKHPDIIIS